MAKPGPLAREIMARDAAELSPSIRLPFFPLVVRRASGAVLEDVDGYRYIDFLSMACIANTGHGHPRVVRAIQEQAAGLLHCNAAYAFHEPLTRLTSDLIRITPGTYTKRVAYGLSGSDANDGALKLVRASTGRPKVIAFLGSYHGNTYGALSLSAVNLAMRRRFGPAVPDVYHIPYPDVYRASAGQQKAEVSAVCLKALTHLLETIAPPEEVAAVFLEPIQGDAGIIEPPVEFVGGLQQICRQHGILIVAEEVQTGMARTGPWFASEYLHLDPDVIVIGKALASGMPLSAIVARAELMEQWQAPGHVFSTGANPVCCAAASATISVIEEEHLGENAASVGKYLREQLEQLGARYEFIGDIRGRGLMLGVDLVMDRRTKERARALASKVVWRCYELGLFLTFLNGSVLRIAPPLVVTLEQAEAAVAILAQALDDSVSGRVPDSVVEKVKGW